MKKLPRANLKDDLLREYDFTEGARGKYAKRFARGTNLVVLAPDVARLFPDSQSVNEGLRVLGRLAGRGRRKTVA